MKFFSLIFIVLCIVTLPFSGKTQNDNAIIEVTALRVEAAFAEPYLTKYQPPNFDINAKGILRPHEGYQIMLNLEKSSFRIVPKGHKQLEIEKEFDVESIPGGTITCVCHYGSGECKAKLNIGEGKLVYFCEGSCSCLKLLESDPFKIPEYETEGGGWSDF